MRAWALVAILVSVPLAGCNGDVGLRYEVPNELPAGLQLTYEVDGGTEETWLVVPGPGGSGYDLVPYDTTRPSFAFPFLSLGVSLTPRDPAWANFFTYPLSDGRSYEARALDRPAQVEITELGPGEAAFGDMGALLLTATADDGSVLARVQLLEEPPVLGLIEVGPGTPEASTWTLTDWELDPLWDGPPLWEVGRYWRYEAQSLAASANVTLVYNANDTGTGGSPLAVLNAQQLDGRVAALPFHLLRRADLASQSGILTNILSKQWDWPLTDGTRWAGSTLVGGSDIVYQAQVTFTPGVALPDGSHSSTFEIVATKSGEAEPFAWWNYAPRVQYFTHLRVVEPDGNGTTLNWTLTDWGEAFHGPMEIPVRRLAYNRSLTSGPAAFTDTFQVGENITTLEVKGTAVRREDSPTNATVRLVAPGDVVALERNQTHFAAAQVVQLTTLLPSSPGTWRLEAELPEGTAFFVQVITQRATIQQFDYRRSS